MLREKLFNHGIPFAWHPQSERMVTAAEVSKGLNCNCVCAACAAPLIARQGELRIWHFAHHRESNCSHAAEAAVHAMAKQLIFDRKGIFVPYRSITRTVHGQSRVWTENLVVEVQEAGFTPITDCRIEKTIGVPSSDSRLRRPDLIAHLTGQPLAIEIHNTHAVDLEKQQWLEQQGYSVLEIDVSDLAMVPAESIKDDLERRLFEPNRHAIWLTHIGDSDAQVRLDALEWEVREAKIALEAKLLAKMRSTEVAKARKAAYLKRIHDVEQLKIRIEGCTLRIGRNEQRVTLKLHGRASDDVFASFMGLARQLSGKFNLRGRCWEFYTDQHTKAFFDLLSEKAKAIVKYGFFGETLPPNPVTTRSPLGLPVSTEHTRFVSPTFFHDPNLQELFDERAGILQYEAGLSREDAEQQAMAYVVMNLKDFGGCS